MKSRATIARYNVDLAWLANHCHPGADYVVTKHADGVIELKDRNWDSTAGDYDKVWEASLESCRQRAWSGCTARAAPDVLPRNSRDLMRQIDVVSSDTLP